MHYVTFISYICHFATLFCVSAQFCSSNENNVIHLLPAYAIASRASLLGTATCATELLRDFLDAVDQRILWGLKTLDSSGELKPGFLYGNNFWLGSRSQCFDIMNKAPLQLAKRYILNNTRYRDPQDEFPPFQLNYFVAYIRHNSTLQYHTNTVIEDLITLGLCLPASCSTNNISFILEGIFRDRILLINNLYSVDLNLIQIKNLKDNHQWLLNGAIPFICLKNFLSFFGVFVNCVYYISRTKKKKSRSHVENAIEMQMTDLSSSRKKSRIGNVLMCFSVYTSTKMIFNTKLGTEITVVHGIKFLTMVWVIILHCIFLSIEYADNKIQILRFDDNLPIQIFSNGSVSVDTYFFLSGFLLAYTYLKNKIDKERINPINYKEKINKYFVIIMKRYIRLTPAYIMMIGLGQLSSAWYDKNSPFYFEERSHEICAKYWWRNILYINNLFGYKKMCLFWSWYLSNDMQFYIIGLALLILSTVYFYVAVVILSTILIASVILSGYISYIYEYVPTLDELYRLLDVLYYPPWIRIGPYIIGMITGYVTRRFNKKIALKRNIVILCWTLGAACNILVLFGVYKTKISVLSAAIYVALSRTVWAIGIAWIVIMCCTEHGDIVKKLLSCKIWIPLSRLTYCAYLLNPFIIHSIRLHSETSTHFELLSISAMIIGYLVISYFCAYAMYLMAESPYILLMQMFSQSYNRKRNMR
ncbi:NRF6 protein, partial [Acromyrmex charruanus]